jgi:RNA polymerase sigma-70 factor (ECF subfamily)
LTEPGDGLFEKFAACREDVFRVCLGFSRNFVDAEDLCQDVFVKALARADDLREPGKSRIWLLRIARTTCLDHLRWTKRRPTVPLDRFPGALKDPGQPEAPVAAAPDIGRVKDAVRRLPRKQRDVFVLREYGGLSYEEIALTLKTKLGTVMSRLSRARRAVARIVEEET